MVSKISGLPWTLGATASRSSNNGPFDTANPRIDGLSVVKAQILAGGRGKGKYESDGKGGVRIMSS